MRRLAVSLLLVATIPAQGWALNTDQLLSTIAMPLAVAAVSNVTGVPSNKLADLVSTLNQANVPPNQFVEVIRYVPVALTVQNDQQPDFVQFVRDEAARGVTGDALVNAIVNQLRTNYNITPRLALTEPATTIVVRDDYIPPLAVTRIGTASPGVNDLLSLIGLPLAVAAVANFTGVPQDELANLVAALNQANVPPMQVIEVVRYAPVALVDPNAHFVQFVQQQSTQGVTGPALVTVVERRLQTFFPAQTQITIVSPPPQQVFVERDFVPPVVITRVQEVRKHPHGGPPGQLKKQLGLQTGAEVVHGEKRGRTPVVVAPQPRQEKERGGRHGRREHEAARAPMISSAPVAAPAPQQKDDKGEKGGNQGQNKDKGQKDKGRGKGNGKD